MHQVKAQAYERFDWGAGMYVQNSVLALLHLNLKGTGNLET